MLKRQVFVVFFLLGLFGSKIFASCGSANCPMVPTQKLKMTAFEGWITVDYADQNKVFVGSNESTIGAIKQHHDEVQTLNKRYTIGTRFQFNSNWGLSVELPFVSREHSHNHNHHGAVLVEKWNFTDIGDMVTTLHYTLWLGETHDDEAMVQLNAGVKLNTGQTAVTNAGGTVAEIPLQPGSGSTDYRVGIQAQKSFFNWPLRASLTHYMTGVGTDGYRIGNTTLASLGTQFSLGNSWALGLDGVYQVQQFSEPGTTGESVANTGFKQGFVVPSVQLALNSYLSVKTNVHLPVYQSYNGIQLAAPFYISCSLAVTM